MKRVVNISVVFCHTTGEGMCSIYYNASNDDFTRGIVQNHAQFGLFSKVLDHFGKTWKSQQKETMEEVAAIVNMGG